MVKRLARVPSNNSSTIFPMQNCQNPMPRSIEEDNKHQEIVETSQALHFSDGSNKCLAMRNAYLADFLHKRRCLVR